MFNNNRLHLVIFAAVVCMQMVHGMHYRKNKKHLPQGAEVTQIKAAQAAMHPKEPLESMRVTILFNAPFRGLNQEADEERSSDLVANGIGCCLFTSIAACTLFTAYTSIR